MSIWSLTYQRSVFKRYHSDVTSHHPIWLHRVYGRDRVMWRATGGNTGRSLRSMTALLPLQPDKFSQHEFRFAFSRTAANQVRDGDWRMWPITCRVTGSTCYRSVQLADFQCARCCWNTCVQNWSSVWFGSCEPCPLLSHVLDMIWR